MNKTMWLGALMGLVGLVLITVAAITRAPLPYWIMGAVMVAGALGLTRPR